MSKQSDHNQVIRDEHDAEEAFQAHIEWAKIYARNMSDDAARTEAQRLAAAETEAALEKVEEARTKAETQHPTKVKKTFWNWMLGLD